jgi:hypothetical protein
VKRRATSAKIDRTIGPDGITVVPVRGRTRSRSR